MRIGKPEKIGDSNYEVLTEGLIEFSDNYNKLEFIFSDPFTGQDGTDYRSELKDGQWIISLKERLPTILSLFYHLCKNA